MPLCPNFGSPTFLVFVFVLSIMRAHVLQFIAQIEPISCFIIPGFQV